MSKYGALDAAIETAVRKGGNPLYDKTVNAEAALVAASEGREEMRVIDGRLQALKRAKKIRYQRGPGAKWVLA